MTEAYQNKAKAKAKNAWEALSGGAVPEAVAKEFKYQDVPSMIWQLQEKGFLVEQLSSNDVKVETKANDVEQHETDSVGAVKRRKAVKRREAAPDANHDSSIKIYNPAIKFYSLAAQSWRGTFFKFGLTGPDGECALPDRHVQAELLHGELGDLVDDVVAGGVLPLEIASKTYQRYAELLKAAAEEMESASIIFSTWASK